MDTPVDNLRTTWFTFTEQSGSGHNPGGHRGGVPGRESVRFTSGNTECAAWHYPGSNGACVIMAGGFAVTKEPATDLFARRFHDAGFSVVAFDYRRIGESGGGRARYCPSGTRSPIGRPRSDTPPPCPKSTRPGSPPGVSPPPAVASSAWRRATRGSPRRSPRHRTPTTSPRHATPRATRSRLRCCASCPGHPGRRGRPHRPRSAAGAAVRSAGDRRGPHHPGQPRLQRGAEPRQQVPDWQQAVAARSALRLGFARPGRYASRSRCPLLVLVCDQDQSALPGPAVRAAGRTPHAELVRLSGGHCEPFLGGHEEAVEAELSFLRRHLVAGTHTDSQAAGRRRPRRRCLRYPVRTTARRETSRRRR